MSESKKGDLAIRDKAILGQQRRLKQATQFTHKDSADLLPLDGLKRLGTSKDLQPHSIVQRRLMAGNITQLRGEARVGRPSPLVDSKEGGAGDAEEKSESTADDSTEERDSPEESERSLETRSDEEEEEDSSEAGGKTSSTAGNDKTEEGRKERQRTERHLTTLLVQCKCCDTEVKACINTGSQHNRISSSCCRRLGLDPTQEGPPCEQTEGQGSVRGLQLQLGRQSVQCSAHVTEDEVYELCLGLQTLQEIKCCVDLSSRVLKLQGSGEELPFLEPPLVSQCHHQDSNENM
ncbi:nuclear receptor-interacting protein 2 [Oncorhynchus tshawytscha]|uniref:Aspartic peptidase DDI1-type domain-containing protein n=1 Tax=Oncorhynchus tshawytscha TaxID=74940 RepID=A0AAZ3PSH2_ONCTS|nr:nuclear receptor-interacting protein 2 [Oncorhynchus tshawytscha]